MPEYRTISKKASAEFYDKRSRFIGTILPVSTEKMALEFLSEQRQKYRDATHNVYAYVLREENTSRYSDDGEPHGSAGMPMLGVIQKSGITDCAAVVTRYFGGVLLGTGGLVHAYSEGVRIAVQAAGISVMRLCKICRITAQYTELGRLESFLQTQSEGIIKTDYSDTVSVEFYVDSEKQGLFEAELADAFFGKLKADVLSEKYFEFLKEK